MTHPDSEPGVNGASLPIVTEEVKYGVAGEFNEKDNLIREVYFRMVTEQPELTSQMAGFIQQRARDDGEQLRMMETMV